MRFVWLAGLGLIGAVAMQSTVRAADAAEDDAVSAYEERSVKYTGGPYRDEVFHYRLLKPAVIEPGKKYPLVLFLHGAGERGNDNVAQLKYFPEMMASAEYREKYPCFVLAPQCRREQKWVDADWSEHRSHTLKEEPTDLMKVVLLALEHTLENEPIDEDRIYLTGLSMGGFGSWDLAARRPELFAAIGPICGGGDPAQAEKLKDLPIWAWHGDDDKAVRVERSREMIEALKKAGGMPKYSELPGVGHNSWTPAYTEADGLTPWLFEQRKSR